MPVVENLLVLSVLLGSARGRKVPILPIYGPDSGKVKSNGNNCEGDRVYCVYQLALSRSFRAERPFDSGSALR